MSLYEKAQGRAARKRPSLKEEQEEESDWSSAVVGGARFVFFISASPSLTHKLLLFAGSWLDERKQRRLTALYRHPAPVHGIFPPPPKKLSEFNLRVSLFQTNERRSKRSKARTSGEAPPSTSCLSLPPRSLRHRCTSCSSARHGRECLCCVDVSATAGLEEGSFPGAGGGAADLATRLGRRTEERLSRSVSM